MADNNNGSDYASEPATAANGEVDAEELEQLSVRVAEFVQEAAVAFKRMAQDHEEIEQLKAETRAILKSLRAA